MFNPFWRSSSIMENSCLDWLNRARWCNTLQRRLSVWFTSALAPINASIDSIKFDVWLKRARSCRAWLPFVSLSCMFAPYLTNSRISRGSDSFWFFQQTQSRIVQWLLRLFTSAPWRNTNSMRCRSRGWWADFLQSDHNSGSYYSYINF